MICPHCGENVEGTWEDVGIGSYEYWGAKGNDVQMVFLCENCEGELEYEKSYQEQISEMGNNWRYDQR